MFKRAFTTSRSVAQQASTSSAPAAPLRRNKDPLLTSAVASHYTLPSGAHFVVRSPPSTLPPSHPVPSSSLSASTLLKPSAAATAEHLLPVSRSSAAAGTSPKTHLTAEELSTFHALRQQNPSHWTRSKLAAKFGVSPKVVGTLGWGEGSAARKAERERKESIEAAKEKREGRWGWKKSIAREERRRRRELW